MSRAVIVGASSGIGREIAKALIADGWTVGVAARRVDRLEELRGLAPGQVVVRRIDVTDADADVELQELIQAVGGIDLYLHVSGYGKQNPTLDPAVENTTVATNAGGFCRLVGCAFRHFARQGHGHIAAVTSIAGTRGMGAAPSYSATKAFQNSYLEALAQQARMRHIDIAFTDIRPGFVDTDFLAGCNFPMMLDPREVAKAAVKAIGRRRPVLVIDWRWRIVTALWKLIPHSLWRRMRIG